MFVSLVMDEDGGPKVDKEPGMPGMMYFRTKSGAKEPQNPQNHRVAKDTPANWYL